MTELKMHQQAPLGIHQKTIIQHTLRFSDTKECFHNFRLVCKSWKDAVETIRFNRIVGPEILSEFDYMIYGDWVPMVYCLKYLALFKKILIPLNLEGGKILSIILNSMKKLNAIKFDKRYCRDGESESGYCNDHEEEFDSFLFQILQNSRGTLRTLHLPKFIVLPDDLFFPNLTELTLCGTDIFFQSQNFQINFPKILKIMSNLENVFLDLGGRDSNNVYKYIFENYARHCISATASFWNNCILNLVPVYILEDIKFLKTNLENTKYISHLQHAHFVIDWEGGTMRDGWDTYQESFDQCTNLKAIELDTPSDGNFIKKILPNLSQIEQEIWNERISYFQARGIHLAGANEISGNKNLRKKFANTAEITWKFHFN